MLIPFGMKSRKYVQKTAGCQPSEYANAINPLFCNDSYTFALVFCPANARSKPFFLR
jgi:hypothetical protein